MNTASRLAPWINRIALTAATLIFTMIGLRYITDPVRASAATGVTLGSALASTTTRVAFGAFPLGIAIFTLTCLVSTRRLVAGASLVAIVVTTAILVRLFGTWADGPAAASVRLFIPEVVLVALSVSGILLEQRRVE